MKTILSATFVLLALIGAVIAWCENTELRRDNAALAGATATHARLRAETIRAEQTITNELARRMTLAEEIARVNATIKGGSSGLGVRSRPTSPSPADEAKLLARFRDGLGVKYRPFYRAMAFTPERIARFEELLVSQEGRRHDLTGAAVARGLPFTDPAIETLRQQDTAKTEAELREFLGDDGCRKLEEYQGGADHRRIVRQLVGDLALSAQPLSPDQGQQLMRVLAELKFDGKAGADRATWDPVLSRAGAFLGPTQLITLQVQAISSQNLAALNEMSRLIRQSNP